MFCREENGSFGGMTWNVNLGECSRNLDLGCCVAHGVSVCEVSTRNVGYEEEMSCDKLGGTCKSGGGQLEGIRSQRRGRRRGMRRGIGEKSRW